MNGIANALRRLVRCYLFKRRPDNIARVRNPTEQFERTGIRARPARVRRIWMVRFRGRLRPQRARGHA
jgi:hypothetical protein